MKEESISMLVEKLKHHVAELNAIMQELHSNDINVCMKVLNGYVGNSSKPSITITELRQITDYLTDKKKS